MIILYPAGFRREWIDRNAIPVIKSYQGFGVAPHGNTSRFTYTVTSGKKALVTYLSLSIQRITVAAPIGNNYLWVTGIINSVGLDIPILKILLNTIGDYKVAIYPQTLLMSGGDSITCNTGDFSTGGTVDYFANMQVIEFDP